MKIRKKIIFSGRVQGVGFRYKSYYLAESLSLSGYVKNLYNGKVLMEVEGEESNIDILLQRLNNDRFIVIDNLDIKTIPSENGSSFCIK